MTASARVPRPRLLDTSDDVLGWLAARGVRGLSVDSRRIQPGDAFVAWPGHAVDGRTFVPQALAAGAVACLVEDEGSAAFEDGEIDTGAVARFRGLHAATGEIADRWFGEPSRSLDVIAVTGTNGKTSTAWWVAQALSHGGERCGLIGTLGIGAPPPDATLPIESTGMTTPDPVAVQRAFRRFVDAGFAACAIEATSIGLAEHRLAGVRIGIAVFTNFTQDHLDYHGSMGAYWQAKAQLFAWAGLRAAVVNLDDPQGATLAESLGSANSPAGGAIDLWTYSARGAAGARLQASEIRYLDAAEGGGLGFDIAEANGAAPPTHARVRTGIVGDFHLGNLLATLGALRASNVPLDQAVAACGVLTPVPGRMQRVAVAGDAALPEVVVDYAHTPDALEKALTALRPLAAARGGALWCVFGCGGDRDAGKRPAMGAIAARLADRTVVTSDNPRHESPEAIVGQIALGWTGPTDRLERIVDRRAAVAHAIAAAHENDLVLLAGKGHEDYQDIAGVRQPLSDADEARAALVKRIRGETTA